MKKLLFISLLIPSVCMADAQELQLYCRAFPDQCHQLIARQLGLDPVPPTQKIVVQTAPEPSQPTVYEQLREQQKATYTNCEENGNQINCTSQVH